MPPSRSVGKPDPSCPDSFRASTFLRRLTGRPLIPPCCKTRMPGTSPGRTTGGVRRGPAAWTPPAAAKTCNDTTRFTCHCTTSPARMPAGRSRLSGTAPEHFSPGRPPSPRPSPRAGEGDARAGSLPSPLPLAGGAGGGWVGRYGPSRPGRISPGFPRIPERSPGPVGVRGRPGPRNKSGVTREGAETAPKIQTGQPWNKSGHDDRGAWEGARRHGRRPPRQRRVTPHHDPLVIARHRRRVISTGAARGVVEQPSLPRTRSLPSPSRSSRPVRPSMSLWKKIATHG